MNVRNNVLKRVEAVKATRLADQIIIEDYVEQKIDDILNIMEHLCHWLGLEEKLDYLNEFCKVVYLPHTGDSSTMLRAESQELVKTGIE